MPETLSSENFGVGVDVGVAVGIGVGPAFTVSPRRDAPEIRASVAAPLNSPRIDHFLFDTGAPSPPLPNSGGGVV